MVKNWIAFLCVVLFSPETMVDNTIESSGSDTLRIEALGTDNKIYIDSTFFYNAVTDSCFKQISGELKQTGSSNQIILNIKNDSTAKKTMLRLQQNGNNNKIKINSN